MPLRGPIPVLPTQSSPCLPPRRGGGFGFADGKPTSSLWCWGSLSGAAEFPCGPVTTPLPISEAGFRRLVELMNSSKMACFNGTFLVGPLRMVDFAGVFRC